MAGEQDLDLAAQAMSALASLHALAGDGAGGLRLATQAIEAAERAVLRMARVMAMVRAGETAVLAGDFDRARECLADGLRIISELGTERYLGDCCELVALVQLARGDPGAAAVMFGASAAVHERTGGASKARFVAQRARAGRERLAGILGAGGFDSCEREGRNLLPGQIIDRARACLRVA
jgi:hypothetical protein